MLNCKLHIEVNWTKICVMSNVATATTFKITNTQLYAPVVTLPTKENLKLTKLLSKCFKSSVFSNEYKSKIETHELGNNNLKRFLLDSTSQGVNRLFVLAFNNTQNDDNHIKRNSHQKYFLPKVKLTKCNVLINGLNFYDQPVSEEVIRYNELRKLCTENMITQPEVFWIINTLKISRM